MLKNRSCGLVFLGVGDWFFKIPKPARTDPHKKTILGLVFFPDAQGIERFNQPAHSDLSLQAPKHLQKAGMEQA